LRPKGLKKCLKMSHVHPFEVSNHPTFSGTLTLALHPKVPSFKNPSQGPPAAPTHASAARPRKEASEALSEADGSLGLFSWDIGAKNQADAEPAQCETDADPLGLSSQKGAHPNPMV
jgi:hypothetical protein